MKADACKTVIIRLGNVSRSPLPSLVVAISGVSRELFSQKRKDGKRLHSAYGSLSQILEASQAIELKDWTSEHLPNNIHT